MQNSVFMKNYNFMTKISFHGILRFYMRLLNRLNENPRSFEKQQELSSYEYFIFMKSLDSLKKSC